MATLNRLFHLGQWEAVRLLCMPAAARGACALALALTAAAVLWYARSPARPAAPLAAPPAAALPTPPAAWRSALQAFDAALASRDDLPDIVQALIAAAERQGLQLARGSYRLEPVPGAAFVRYRMSLPVTGNPARIQAFVEQALLVHPALAIDSIQYQRRDGQQAAVEAHVQWVQYVRTTSSATASPAPGSNP